MNRPGITMIGRMPILNFGLSLRTKFQRAFSLDENGKCRFATDAVSDFALDRLAARLNRDLYERQETALDKLVREEAARAHEAGVLARIEKVASVLGPMINRTSEREAAK